MNKELEKKYFHNGKYSPKNQVSIKERLNLKENKIFNTTLTK